LGGENRPAYWWKGNRILKEKVSLHVRRQKRKIWAKMTSKEQCAVKNGKKKTEAITSKTDKDFPSKGPLRRENRRKVKESGGRDVRIAQGEMGKRGNNDEKKRSRTWQE